MGDANVALAQVAGRYSRLVPHAEGAPLFEAGAVCVTHSSVTVGGRTVPVASIEGDHVRVTAGAAGEVRHVLVLVVGGRAYAVHGSSRGDVIETFCRHIRAAMLIERRMDAPRFRLGA